MRPNEMGPRGDTQSGSERLLILLLRLSGGVMSLAWAAILLPQPWMASVNDWIGLPPLDDGPLVEYLARTVSAFYAIQGGIFLLTSRDLPRFMPVITYMAVTHLLFGAILLWVDLKVGMPLLWTLGEGPPVIVLNAVVLVLIRRIR